MTWRRPSSVAAGLTLLLAGSVLAGWGSAWSDATGGRAVARLAVPVATTAGPVEVVAHTSGDILMRPVLVSDRSGTSTAVWAEGCTLRAARRAPSGGWSQPEVISSDSSAGCADPQVGVDRTGRVTVVWERVGRGWRSDVLLTTRPRDGGWSPVLQLTRGRGYRQGSAPQIQVAASGASLVTWQRVNGSRADFARVGPKARWTSWTRVKPHHVPRLPAELVDTAVANNGTALVVGYDANAGSGSTALYARPFAPGRGWGLALRVGNGEFPRLVVNARGAGLLAWFGSRSLGAPAAAKVRRLSRTGRWWPSRRMSRFSGLVAITAVIGPRRQVTVAWTRAGVTHTMSQAVPRGRWSGSILRGLRRRDALIALVQDQRGDQALLWGSQGGKVSQSRIAVRRHNGRWSPAQLIGRTSCITGRANACSQPALTVLPDGTALTVWADPEHQLVARALPPITRVR